MKKLRHYSVFPLLAGILLFGGCDRANEVVPDAGRDPEMVKVAWLLYEEEEQGTGEYPVRILVGEHHLRFDDNFDGSDFLLLDRRTHTLYSVSHEESSILVIESSEGDVSLPPGIILSEVRSEDEKAPTIGGSPPVHIRYMANNTLCYEAVIVPGLLIKATQALEEYAGILGRRQLSSLDAVPEDMQTPCFLTRYAYRPARHYEEGLPVQEWDGEGYVRTLVDYGELLDVSSSLFVLPADYARFQIN